MITIKFFASLKEQLGTDEITLDIGGAANVAELRASLLTRGDDWQALDSGKVLCAVNHTLCDDSAAIKDGDEVAFFPPVTGG